MRELKFDGLSPDGTTLVLVGKDGQKWSLTIDERIEAAVRRDRARISQVEIEQSGELRPREIQARIRAGATAEDVAAASGLPLEHIRRFEGPVLTERAWVAHQAQATEVRRPAGDIRLGDLVVERLDTQGVDPETITWDAWRRDDGTWVVIATFPVGPNTHVATWTYDSGSRTMTVLDDNARTLSAIDPSSPLHLTQSRPSLTSVSAAADETAQAEAPGAVVTALPSRGRGAVEPAEPDGAAVGAAGDVPDAEADLGVGDPPSGWEEDPARSGATDDEGAAEVEEAGGEAEAAAGDVPVQDADDAGTEPEPADEPAPRASSDADETGLFPAPETGHRPTRRPSVPSFDDILFGPPPGSSH